jgi:hypothetical protein
MIGAAATSALQRAEAAWGEALPDWVRALAEAADRTSQAKASAAIGYSAATVSYVLKGTYAGDMAKVEQAVRASIMEAGMECPELGTLRLADCLDWQGKAACYQPTSSRRLLMYRACRACGSRARPARGVGARGACARGGRPPRKRRSGASHTS